MTRVMELAAGQPGEVLSGASCGSITRDDIVDAAEVLIVGTTPDVSALVELDGSPVGGGKPGPVQAVLNRLLGQDITGNEAMRTDVFAG